MRQRGSVWIAGALIAGVFVVGLLGAPSRTELASAAQPGPSPTPDRSQRIEPVQGPDPADWPQAHFPFTMGGVSSTGVIRPVLVDTDGTLHTTGGGAASTPFPYGANTPVPVQPNGAVAAQTPMAVALAGQQVAVRSTVVLPAQTPVAYTAGDVVTSATPAALTFANACRTTGGSGYVVGADLATDQSTNTANYRLWLYQSPPPTLVADNAANTLLFANNAIRVGYVDIPNLATNTGSNTAAYGQVPDARLSYTCAAGSTTLSGVLEAEVAFTPASGQIVDAGLRVQRD